MDGTEQGAAPKGIKRMFPTLARDDRLSLVELFEKSAKWNIDFIVMMGLATALAALGLMQSSTPVVIGAMLVAPLMSPLIGSGFAIVQGNINLFKGSLKATFFGVLSGLLISLLLGFCTLEYEPTLEIMARGNVNLLDLLVAFLSGMAAAYSMGRPDLFATIAGVAIAAALVPPLAVIGIATASGIFWLAGASAVLLLTNLIAIMLGAAVIFRCLGVHGSLSGEQGPLWARRSFMALMLAVGMLVYPLAERAQKQARLGQTRPHTYPASLKVRQAIQDRVDEESGVEVMAVARVGIEPDHGINIILVSNRDLSKSLPKELDRIVDRTLQENIKVRVVALQGRVDDYLKEIKDIQDAKDANKAKADRKG
ncbi:MAG: TIGR00341 family protein [Desulfuromonadales bacterium]|nr:TIGR00341 family protein [Desulfuromonadales bacterium]